MYYHRHKRYNDSFIKATSSYTHICRIQRNNEKQEQAN